MKFLSSIMAATINYGKGRKNLRSLARYLIFLGGLVTLYSLVFHLLMAREGQEHSWLTGFYWSLTVMSTLGFGDITFQSDLGRAFSIVVLLTGMISLLVVLPFVFIEFFYVPFLDARVQARTPRRLPEKASGHVVITEMDPVSEVLIDKLKAYHYPYVVVCQETAAAAALADRGIEVVVGKLIDPQTYRNIRVEQAAMLVATGNDIINTNIAFTARALAPELPIVVTARDPDAVDILELAGASRVVQLGEMLGASLARRTLSGDARSHLIGRFDQLVIAEATPAGTPLVGQTLARSRLRERTGVTVIGAWERGAFAPASPETVIRDSTVLVLAGTRKQLQAYDELFWIYNHGGGAVLIIGSGRVGRATARALAKRGVDYRILDRDASRLRDPEKSILGNAVDRAALDRAGINEAPAVIITTRDDDINTYLTLYCRRLRPEIQIISRSNRDDTVATMHRAGADFVMSYASMGASAFFNYLQRGDILMLAEGLDVFRMRVPKSLAGKSLRQADIRAHSGCHVIAFAGAKGMMVNPDPSAPMNPSDDLVMIGSVDSEKRFLERYG